MTYIKRIPERSTASLRRTLGVAASLCLVSLLGACGGGGGGSSTPAPIPVASPPPPPTPTAPTAPPSNTLIPESMTDVVFSQAATANGSRDLLLDVYQSGEPCDALRPFAVMVHGGGFKIGTKSTDAWREIGEGLAARDIVGVAITYRLVGDDPLPAAAYLPLKDRIIAEAGGGAPAPEDEAIIDTLVSAAEDTVAAIEWVKDNAADLCVDPTRFAVWGSSAGANLAINVSYALDDIGLPTDKPDVVIDYWGNQEVKNTMRAGDPPIFILHGDQDTTIAYSEALALQADAEANGVPYAFYTVEGAFHGFGTIGASTNGINGKTFNELAIDFAEAHLRNGTPVYEQRGVSAEASADGNFNQNFNTAPLGILTSETLDTLFETPTNVLGVDAGRVEIVNGGKAFSGNAAEISLPAFALEPEASGAQWTTRLASSFDTFHLSYRVRFAPGFDFSVGGTLPGLAGGDETALPNGRNGWRAPMIWQRGGQMAQRLVTPGQSSQGGNIVPWDFGDGTQRRFRSDVWYTIEQRVIMNTPGQSDGAFVATLNGELAARETGLRFRDNLDLGVDVLLFAAFYGGDEVFTQPTEAGTIIFDDIAISTNPIGQE